MRFPLMLLLCGVVVLFVSKAPAATTESIRVFATVGANEYNIGDQIDFAVTVEWKKPLELVRIEPSMALGVFEIVRTPEVKRKRLGRGWQQELTRYFLSTFETGDFTIPEFTVVYRDAEGNEKRVPTPPVPIKVVSVAPMRADDEGIRDAKPPVLPPARLTIGQVFAAAAIVVVLAALAAALLIRYLRKRRDEPAPDLPARPIEDVAREELARVAESDLLARGLIKEYFDQISDIIRIYLGRRYGFEGIVTTTTELLDELQVRMGDENRLFLVSEFSEEADLAKFAKWRPDRDICGRFLEMAYRVVEETSPLAATAGDVGPYAGERAAWEPATEEGEDQMQIPVEDGVEDEQAERTTAGTLER